MVVSENGLLASLTAPNRPAEALRHLPAGSTGVKGSTLNQDTVDLTTSGREVNAALKDARSLPDVREDRVTQLRRQLERGTYRVNGHGIAANMIGEALENNQVIKHIDSKA